MRTRVKICGITRPEDALAAAASGADAIGMVFWHGSPRSVKLEEAIAIRSVLPPLVSLVALFVDPDPSWVDAVVQAVKPDLLQFHGSESVALCERLGHPWIKALKVGDGSDLQAQMTRYHSAAGFLLDSHDPVRIGGTGQRFDWSQAPEHAHRPLIVAGGLTPDNVGQAVAWLRPWAVDVSSGVESAPGRKDHDRIKQFVAAVRLADAGDGTR